MNKLEQARLDINEADRKIAELFEQRMRAVEDVIAYKIENNLPVFDGGREKQVIEKNSQLIQNKRYLSYYCLFIQNMMDLSKSYQQSIVNGDTYGYQGSVGAFAHIALTQLFPHGKEKNYPTWEAVIQAVLNHEIAKGVLPFENSYTGEVGEVLDLLFHYDCVIQEVYDLKINQNLLVLKDAKLSDIRQVYSHHQAISQCADYLKPFDFELIPYANTAMAAKYVSETNDKSKAAIASVETAELYDLKVIASNINTSKDNTTRFVVLGNELNLDGDHVAIVFTVNHESGQLAKIMEIIARYGFNMENIKSRSLKNASWQYYFYIEIAGSYQDAKMQEMLAECEMNSRNFKVIGSYKYVNKRG